MKIFFDTEFTGLHKDTTLISIGMIAEDGRTFYAEFSDYDATQVNDWIKDNVITNLKFNEYTYYVRALEPEKFDHIEMKGTKRQVVQTLENWLAKYQNSEIYPGGVQLVSDVCHYDMVLFIDLFGGAFDLPGYVNASCHDINQDIATYYGVSESEAFEMSREEILKKLRRELPTGDKHNSLYDAMVIEKLYDFVSE